MNFKAIKNQANEYTLFIDDEIGMAVNGKQVAREIAELERMGVPKMKVVINSVGGSVFHGYSIIDAILNSKIEIEGKIIVAMSIASIIALACKNNKNPNSTLSMVDFGLCMIHDPYLSGGNELSDSDKQMLTKVKNALVTIYKNSTNIDEKEIISMMQKETYLDANEAYDLGLIDSIIMSKKPELANKFVELVNRLEKYNNTMEETNDKFDQAVEDTNVEAVETVEAVEETTDQNTEENTDENTEETTNEVEETESETSEEVTNEEEQEEDNIVVELENKVKELEDKLKEYETKEEMALENKVVTFLEDYKKDLSEDEYSKWKNIGKDDFSFMSNSFSKLVNKKTMKIEDVVNMEEKREGTDIDIRKMEKEDPKALKEIFENNFELYKRSFEKAYGVEYTEK